MANVQHCSECGAELDPALPRGLCGQCLISLGLTSGRTELAVEQPRSVPSPAATDPLNPPTLGRIGDYELLEEVARGGMGVVYKARQVSLGRIVAVKMVLAGQFVDKKVIQRFQGEVTTAALLHHPNIVSVHEVGMHAGQPFFSMDYVEGQNLAQLVGNHPLPPKNAARYLKLIAEAIQYAHSQGILHRDLKPSNVLIEAASDQPRVTDFGLARRLDSESSLTLTGQVLGSPGFTAPEQAGADHGRVGRRSDVYALGAILYHLLTARAPFQAESLPAIVNLVLTTEPDPPRLLNPAVPRDLETICLKCLEKEPARRYATAQELADELGRFLNDEPIQARHIGRTARCWRWCRRKPALATLAAIVLLLLLVVVVGAPIAVVRIDRSRAETERNLYAADMRLASEALRNGEVEQVQELLRAHEPRKGEEDLRGFEWRYLRQASDQSGLAPHQLQGVSFSTSLALKEGALYNYREDTGEILAWDTTNWAALPLELPPRRASERWWWRPQEQAALAVDTDGTFAVYRLPGFEKVSVFAVPGKPLEAAVSKDLRTLAVACQDGGIHRIVVWDLATNSQRWSFGEDQKKVTCLRFSPDGNVLLAIRDDGEVGLWSITQGRALPSPARNSATTEHDWETLPRFGPSSGRLYMNRGRGHTALEIWDWSTSELLVATRARLSPIDSFAFSPDGTVVATAGGDGVIELLDTHDFHQIGSMSANGASIFSLCFSQSGRLIVSGGSDRTAKLWDVKAQRELATLGGNDDQVCDVAFTPDEKSVITLTGDGKIKVWDLRAVLRQGLLWSTRAMVYGFAVSRDEQVIAAGDGVGGFHVWDLVTGRGIREVRTGEPGGISVSFSPTDHLVSWTGVRSLGILDYTTGQTSIFPFLRTDGYGDSPFSPDGREVAFAGPTNIMILDVAARKLRPFAITESGVISLAFSPYGRSLASAHADGTLTLWDCGSRRMITKVPAHTRPKQKSLTLWALRVEFSPDGRLLASAGSDATGKLWDVVPGGLKLRHTLRGHVGWVDLGFSPDGRRVVSASNDSTLKLWDPKTGLEVATLYGLGGGVAGFAFSRDGNALYSATQGGEVRIWRAPPLDRLEAPVKEKKIKL